MILAVSPRHLLHDTTTVICPGDTTPPLELPSRVDLILGALADLGLEGRTEPRDFGRGPVAAIHDRPYLEFLEGTCTELRETNDITPLFPRVFSIRPPLSLPADRKVRLGWHASDVYSALLPGTWEAAYWSAQTALTAADELVSTESRVAYALCRPPGHHAGRDTIGGFCYLNNAAIAARFLNRALAARVALIDIDFHHGNGTQEILYDDPQIYFASLHGNPDQAFPYFSGRPGERGSGQAEGTIMNVPLPLGTADSSYLSALETTLNQVNAFAPRALVVSVGFDIAKGDPYGGFLITEKGFAAIGRLLRETGIPLLLVQEGGYLLERLRANARAFFSGILQ